MLRSGRPTLSDVAEMAGVSAATVSRALSRPDMVNAETQARIARAVSALGYSPTGPARALALGRSAMVGAIVPTLESQIFSRALETIQSVLSGNGYQLVVAANNYNPAAEAAVIQSLLSRGVDGLIVVGAERPPEAWSLLERARIPIVLTWCGDPRFDAVTVDNREAGRLAARHLIELGHRSFAIICGTFFGNDRQRQRAEGMREVLAAQGLALPDWRLMQQPISVAGGRAGAAAILSAGEPPTAILCGSDAQAIGCLAEAQARGVICPERLSVVSIDNMDMSAYITPGLTTVHIPTARIGEAAATTILGRLGGSSIGPHLQLPVELVVRQSTRAI